MIRRPVTLPPGTCLTDVWRHLTEQQRREMLRVVQDEAVAVSREAAAYRAAGVPRHQLTPQQAVAAWEMERRAAAERLQILTDAVGSYRVGNPMRRPPLPVPPLDPP